MESIVKNQTVTIKIDDLGTEGEGIGRCGGYTLFVERALPGEAIEATVVKAGKSYGYAKLNRVIEASPYRREPDCRAYGRCGGCSLRHLSYDAQLKYKTKRVSDALARIAGIDNAEVEDCVGMERPYHYRNKAHFPAGIIENTPAFGFYASRSHRLARVGGCLINKPVNDEIISLALEYIKENNISVYDETAHTGVVRHLVTRTAVSGETTVCLCVNAARLPESGKFVEKLRRVPNIVSVAINSNTKRTNAVMGGATKILWGKRYLTDALFDLRFDISPASFFQINPAQTEIVYKTALEFLDAEPRDTVIDAYCGVGAITLCAARRVKKIYGVEISEEAVSDARRNAKLNNIENAEFISGKCEEVLEKLYAGGVKPDKLILDPSRGGCDTKMLETISARKPRRVVYVSCDPATLARDVKILRGHGYEFIKARPADCFAFSPHVETVALLRVT